ncbi:SOS response-associated peptidase [Tuwongella immobilis]|uniref:Abasic site processing protein n=1 Tax=Tuwongella immobilis TaxID=692036 RepID=A0A6C2YR92_9BACT|nr:SOS response-associated peptidase [Tuwongella immobilis]VIP03392.1 Gll2498 protein OS=Gloeobacter violaceus (strain PCC 7421) GN=gll2498 PE=4 SV=1: DUF159 [Tuwongella immobilis]VTS04156.1 Gll2498 protein OS=Gloeobacter violaceus (strain PCC 7421) GN=gll2498 PE=4 SV=1: DUF159 [Tuwongella immobilis]
MCGRFTLTTPEEQLRSLFGLDFPEPYRPRYNIAPTQPVLTIRPNTRGKRETALLRWGLVPSWSQDPRIASKMINARGETLAEKPAFRQAFRMRRCLIVADGFYEWHEANGHSQPYYFHRPNREPFAFAGLWDRWVGSDGSPLETCTIVNTASEGNARMSAIHHRIPVLLDPDDYDRWLDPREANVDRLAELFQPCSEDWLVSVPVSTAVNRVALDDPICLEPLGSQVDLAMTDAKSSSRRKPLERPDQPSLWG